MDQHELLQLKIKDKFDQDLKELDLMKWCTQYLSLNGIFVDIGARLGSFSMLLSRTCRGAFSFETDADFCRQFLINIKQSNIKNIIPYHVKDYTNCFNLNIVNNHQIQLLKIEYDDLDLFINISKLLLNSNFPPFIVRISKNLNILNYIKSLGYKIKQIEDFTGIYFASDHPRYVKNSVIDVNDIIENESVKIIKQDDIKEEKINTNNDENEKVVNVKEENVNKPLNFNILTK